MRRKRPGLSVTRMEAEPEQAIEAALDGSVDLAVVDLSVREREVLRLLAAGSRNREIAMSLGISGNAVQFPVSNLLRKTGTRSRAELSALVR